MTTFMKIERFKLVFFQRFNRRSMQAELPPHAVVVVVEAGWMELDGAGTPCSSLAAWQLGISEISLSRRTWARQL